MIGSVRDVFSAADFQTVNIFILPYCLNFKISLILKWHNFTTFCFKVILRIHEARMRLENLGCFKNVGVLIDTYNGDGACDDGIEVEWKSC